MESAEEPRLIVRHVILTTVTEVKPVYDNAGYEWVHFEGSRESLAFPTNTFAPGNRVKITFERIEPNE